MGSSIWKKGATMDHADSSRSVVHGEGHTLTTWTLLPNHNKHSHMNIGLKNGQCPQHMHFISAAVTLAILHPLHTLRVCNQYWRSHSMTGSALILLKPLTHTLSYSKLSPWSMLTISKSSYWTTPTKIWLSLCVLVLAMVSSPSLTQMTQSYNLWVLSVRMGYWL